MTDAAGFLDRTHAELAYLELLRNVQNNGVASDDRTGTGTWSLFAQTFRCDLSKGFPAVTTKKLAFKTMVTELMWFIAGSTNTHLLEQHGCHIWDEWAPKSGELGPVYGYQWRGLTEHGHADRDTVRLDQLADAIRGIKDNPYGRRHIVDCWNVHDLKRMALPPCHLLFQFYVRNGKLSTSVYQRSADLFLGVPFNIASYALLTHIVAHLTGLKVGELAFTFGDAHIYRNHEKQVLEQLSRDVYPAPHLSFGRAARAARSINAFALTPYTNVGEFFHLDGYKSHPAIKAPVAV